MEEHATELASLAMQTLPTYTDMASQHAVSAALRRLVAQDAFVKALAAAIVRRERLKLPRQQAYVLLCWFLLLLQRLELPAGQKAASKLIQCQVMAVFMSCGMATCSLARRGRWWGAVSYWGPVSFLVHAVYFHLSKNRTWFHDACMHLQYALVHGFEGNILKPQVPFEGYIVKPQVSFGHCHDEAIGTPMISSKRVPLDILPGQQAPHGFLVRVAM